ncbi:MAG: Fic family protein [Candidatus Kapabacteria bacterium]|nr:Fic family protein [Candidatus Kapabacteria bacterium]
MASYIYQQRNWTTFQWDEEEVRVLLAEVHRLRGYLAGRMHAVGFATQTASQLQVLTVDIVRSSEIEGAMLDPDQVRSSIARKLGMDVEGQGRASRSVDGVVEMTLDAIRHHSDPLTHSRLFAWHGSLFPSGRSGGVRIETGCYRTQEMQIVSGSFGRERVHYTAPPPRSVKPEMTAFLTWFNGKEPIDPIIKAAIAHFRFVIIHPFDDGNGRIARALTDLLMARADDTTERYYSLSDQIMADRKKYYRILQSVQHSTGDITEWLVWFLQIVTRALQASVRSIDAVLDRSTFWIQHEDEVFNHRQRIVLNKLFDGLDGKLTTSRWARIAKCSQDSALRDIRDLVEKGILKQKPGGGRNTNYEL